MNATMSLESTTHYPVMLNQILSIISPQHGGTFIDCTFGGGGYSKAILNNPNTQVIAVDRDKLANKYAAKLLEEFPERFSFFLTKFSNLNNVFKSKINPKAIIFDLGLSSHQLADNSRGFSFESKNFINMEMGMNKYSAYDVVNYLDKKNLTNIIKILGEEKQGKLIANKIVNYRKNKPIKTSKELSKIIGDAKRNYRNYKKNPATKTFQAIRIFVNQELTELISGLIQATKMLPNGGMLVVVSFHSLEDKIVKYFFNLCSNFRKKPSRYFPIKENKYELFKLLSKKPIEPDREEILRNNRSRSAKLRYAIRNSNSFSYPEELIKKFEVFFKLEEIRL